MTTIDRVSEFSRVVGRLVSWVLFALMLLSVADVLLRKFANSPIPWAFDVATQLFALHFMLATAYALVDGEHVSVGLVRDRMSPRGSALLDIVAYLALFLPFCIALIYYGWNFADRAWQYGERSQSAAAIPVAWIKTIIPITGAILALQGLAILARAFRVLRTGVSV
ncbi:TRAP transporter small permease subunit [Thalassovita sp.]|uniref:TRAP transporter small permease subunit n=1 Tax=Thalassovita sp. TaxID=1979401 RepID=UPI0029DE6FDC|nr:TRAP transporter small permease subunit [Thalassovita sp.]